MLIIVLLYIVGLGYQITFNDEDFSFLELILSPILIPLRLGLVLKELVKKYDKTKTS